MKKSVKKMIIVVMAAVLALPAMAQWETDEQQNAARPSATFQSTSAMQSSGSSYSTNPMLNADGTAAYDAAAAPAQVPSSGPRKVAPPAPEGDPTPVGDGVWALLLIAAAYAALTYRVRRKQEADSIQSL